jgi:hypothetical protein
MSESDPIKRGDSPPVVTVGLTVDAETAATGVEKKT